MTFASFSQLGDKIAFGSTRGRVWVADISYVSELEPLGDVNYEDYRRTAGETTFLPRVIIDHNHHTVLEEQYYPDIPPNPATALAKYKIIFPNGIILSNIISLVLPKAYRKVKECYQIQFSNQSLTAEHAPLKQKIIEPLVLTKDGHDKRFNNFLF